MIEFVVLGRPIPQPRPSIRVRPGLNGKQIGQAYVPAKHPVHTWRRLVLHDFRQAIASRALDVAESPFPWTGPVGVAIDIRSQAAQSMPKDRASIWDDRDGGAYGGDVDNYAKAILDALQGYAFSKDSQVVCLTVQKVVAREDEEPQAAVAIWSLDGVPVDGDGLA